MKVQRKEHVMSAAGRVAIVTGAGAGIGRATAERLAVDHAGVVVVDRHPERLEWAVGDRFAVVAGDVADPATSGGAVEAALGRFGRLDTVVLNAAVSWTGRLETMPLERGQDDLRRRPVGRGA